MRIRVNKEIYDDIDNIRKKLIEKAGLHRNLSIRETMEIIWNAKDIHGYSLEDAIERIKESNVKIAWGSRNGYGRSSKKNRTGKMEFSIS